MPLLHTDSRHIFVFVIQYNNSMYSVAYTCLTLEITHSHDGKKLELVDNINTRKGPENTFLLKFYCSSSIHYTNQSRDDGKLVGGDVFHNVIC
jgi:hypothetical protein